MANRQRAEARRKAQSKAARSGGGDNKMMLWIALGVVVVLGAGIAFFATRDDGASASSDSTVSTPGNSFPDSQPVTITGEPLTQFGGAGAADLAVGMPAPTLAGLDFRGEAIDVTPAEGPYMLVFLAHWCPHCNAEVPRLIDWRNSGAVPADLNVIGVATANAKEADNYPPSSWFTNKGWPWPVLVDETLGDGKAGKAATAFGASGWPYFVIVGEDGLVKVRVSGEIEASELQGIVETALAG